MTESRQASTSRHSISWYIDAGSIYGLTVCESDESAACRQHCPEGCETWPCGHELVSGDCNVVEWFDNDGLDNCCAYEVSRHLRDGAITVKWEGDFWSWEYADE